MSLGGARAPLIAACAAAGLTLAAGGAQAQDAVANFYKSRNIDMMVGTNPGGGYDLYARLVARYMGDHVPGKPAIVVKNMPGAGHLKMVNWMYNAAPKDGSVIGGAPQAIAIEQALKSEGIQYDSNKFIWVGRAAPVVEVTFTWHTSPTKTLEDARNRETIMGGSGPTSPTVFYLKLLNNLAGTNFKIIASYSGTAEVQLGIERGEIEGGSKAWESMKVDNADWLRDKKVNILLQYSTERAPDLPDVPLFSELGKTPEDKAALKLYALGNELGRAFMTTPGVPKERVAALQKAFMETMNSPELKAEAAKQKIAVGPLEGDKVAKLIADTLATPEPVLQKARENRGY
jgi:tripartite-type tricarboxylate transporter receptor subunit TctC